MFTRVLQCLGIVCWLVCTAALIDLMAFGNPGAFQGVMSFGAVAAAISWVALSEPRHDRRMLPADTSQQVRPDPVRIALLEHSELGIQPPAGSTAAVLIATAKAVDPERCSHDDVIEVLEFGQARPAGMCERCGTSMVQSDEGEWERP